MRVCLVYDHLFPSTVGGGERWMRDLARRLADAGHEVTYLTMRHWPEGEAPSMPGVRVEALTHAGRVYRDERRTLGPPLRFGLAVLRHLRREGRDYDVVHTASFPYFPVLAAAAARRRGRYALVVDWFEVWTRAYWRRYAGLLGGTAGWLVQRLCVAVPHRANCISRLSADRLVAEGYRGTPTVLPGLYAGVAGASTADVDTELIVYAGRHVREKRIDALIRGFAHALERRPTLRLRILGDGPERPRLERLVAELELADAVELTGRVAEEEVTASMARAACVATASEREGYGLVVVEAAANGTPSVVVAGPENAATDLVADGVNGAVAASASPADVAIALLRVVEAGSALRASTARWFADNAAMLGIDGSLDVIQRAYAGPR
jgi:glycosyltransferase involved in cell wall biosynthesis